MDRLALISTSGLAAVTKAAVEASFRFWVSDLAIKKTTITSRAPASQNSRREENLLTPSTL